MPQQLDPRIPLGVQPPDIAGSYERGLTLRDLMGKQQAADEERQAQRTLADLYRGNTDATGTVNRQGLVQGLAGAGLGNRIPALQKQFADMDKAQLDATKTRGEVDSNQFKLVKDRLNLLQGSVASLAAKPDLTHDDVIATAAQLVRSGALPEDQAVQFIRGLPPDPQRLRQALITVGLQAADNGKRLELMLPKTDVKDTGAALQQFNTNQLTGQVTPGPQLAQKTQTPDSAASNATTMRGQNMTDARSRERLAFDQQNAQNQFITVEGVGLYVGDKRTGSARPVMDQNGQPVVPNKPLTEGQAKANLFGTRMQEADQIIGSLAAQGVSSPSLPQEMTGGAGMTGRMATAAATPQQQQVDQAQRNFINAVLRRESGAAISPNEFDSARLQYFVQPGDSPQVIAQKARNRQTAIGGMLAEVPDGKRGVGMGDSGVPDDIAAILRKHRGK